MGALTCRRLLQKKSAFALRSNVQAGAAVYTVGSLACGKERKSPDSMQGAWENTAFASSPRGRSERNLSTASARWQSMLRPCVPGLFALALAVFLWGLGAKLSLYHHHSKPVTRTVVAKLWTGPRSVLLAPGASSGRSSHAPRSGLILPAPAGLIPAFRSHPAPPPADLLNAATFQRSRLPARSPPSRQIL